MQVNPNGQVITNASLVDRTLEGALRRAFLVQKKREASYSNSFLNKWQKAGTDEDMVEKSPQLLKVISALCLLQFLATLWHEGGQPLVDVAKDIVAGLGIEVAHQQNAFALKSVEQSA